MDGLTPTQRQDMAQKCAALCNPTPAARQAAQALRLRLDQLRRQRGQA